jgi:hypothetical protein
MIRKTSQRLGSSGEVLCSCGSRYPRRECPFCPAWPSTNLLRGPWIILDGSRSWFVGDDGPVADHDYIKDRACRGCGYLVYSCRRVVAEQTAAGFAIPADTLVPGEPVRVVVGQDRSVPPPGWHVTQASNGLWVWYLYAATRSSTGEWLTAASTPSVPPVRTRELAVAACWAEYDKEQPQTSAPSDSGPFQVGDVVRCVDASDRKCLTVGACYTVQRVSGLGGKAAVVLEIDGIIGVWLARRFTLFYRGGA